MTGPRAVERLVPAFAQVLAELGERDPSVFVAESGPEGSESTRAFRQKFPARCSADPGADGDVVAAAAELAAKDRTVFAITSAAAAAGHSFGAVRELVCRPRANVKIFASHGGSPTDPEPALPAEDLGMMRALPGMTVVVPSDAPTIRAATAELAGRAGPAYVRLGLGEMPTVSDGTFRVGRAAELRPGTDLALVAIGALVGRSLDVAEELARVGVSTRVLDFASLKPFDEAALLRAARDTGAILTLEEHSVLTGLGSLVAATTSENYPVPVRRVGVPDVFVDPGAPGDRLDRYGMSLERIRDEAWELLRLRGKVQ